MNTSDNARAYNTAFHTAKIHPRYETPLHPLHSPNLHRYHYLPLLSLFERSLPHEAEHGFWGKEAVGASQVEPIAHRTPKIYVDEIQSPLTVPPQSPKSPNSTTKVSCFRP